jgi:hypothetical protein
MIFPAVIKKGDAAVDGLFHQLDRNAFLLGLAKVMASKAQRRDLDVMPAKPAQRNLGRLRYRPRACTPFSSVLEHAFRSANRSRSTARQTGLSYLYAMTALDGPAR